MNKRYETVLRWFEEYGFTIIKKRWWIMARNNNER